MRARGAEENRRKLAIGLGIAALALAGASTLAVDLVSKSEPSLTAVATLAGRVTARAVGPTTRIETGARVVRPQDTPVPILMYHVIADPPPGAPYPELYVAKDEFAGQVAWLASHGYRAVTLRDVYDHWRSGSPLPARSIVLSFDDGYRSHYRNAMPVLRARGWPGVLNLKVRNLSLPWGLSPRKVRALIAAGWEIDAHTLSHPDLTSLEAAELRREVAGSRAVIRRQFGIPVDFFCYPSGRYDATVIKAVKAAGFLGATTVEHGLARPTELFTLDRVRVEGSDGVAGLAAKLRALIPRR